VKNRGEVPSRVAEEIAAFVDRIERLVEGSQDMHELFEEVRQPQSAVDAGLVRVMRQLTVDFLLTHADDPEVNNGLEFNVVCMAAGYDGATDFCDAEVYMFGKEAQSPVPKALSLALGLGLTMAIVDRCSGLSWEDYPPKVTGWPTVHLQFRPGHFDMIYKTPDVEALNSLFAQPRQKTQGIFTLAAPPVAVVEEMREQQVQHKAAVPRQARLSPPLPPARTPSRSPARSCAVSAKCARSGNVAQAAKLVKSCPRSDGDTTVGDSPLPVRTEDGGHRTPRSHSYADEDEVAPSESPQSTRTSIAAMWPDEEGPSAEASDGKSVVEFSPGLLHVRSERTAGHT